MAINTINCLLTAISRGGSYNDHLIWIKGLFELVPHDKLQDTNPVMQEELRPPTD